MADSDIAPDTEGKKTLGLSRQQWIILAVAAAGGVAFIWWRNRQNSANQNSTSDTSGTDTTDTGDTFDGVTPYPMGGLTEAQLEALEASIAALAGKSSTPSPPSGVSSNPITAPGGPVAAKPPGSSGSPKTQWTKYVIQRGDTPSKIASKEKTPWNTIWNFNLGSQSPHSAAAKAELKKEGPNDLKSGQWLAIPKK